MYQKIANNTSKKIGRTLHTCDPLVIFHVASGAPHPTSFANGLEVLLHLAPVALRRLALVSGWATIPDTCPIFIGHTAAKALRLGVDCHIPRINEDRQLTITNTVTGLVVRAVDAINVVHTRLTDLQASVSLVREMLVSDSIIVPTRLVRDDCLEKSIPTLTRSRHHEAHEERNNDSRNSQHIESPKSSRNIAHTRYVEVRKIVSSYFTTVKH